MESIKRNEYRKLGKKPISKTAKFAVKTEISVSVLSDHKSEKAARAMARFAGKEYKVYAIED